MNSGAAGYEAGEKVVFSLDVASDGSYTFKLYEKVDHPHQSEGDASLEDNLAINFNGIVVVNDGVSAPLPLNGSFTVIDDVPVAENRTAAVTAETVPASVNALIILDKSGSMSNSDMALAKAAILDFASQSNVKSIRVLAFDDPADAPSTVWFDVRTPAGYQALQNFLNPIYRRGQHELRRRDLRRAAHLDRSDGRQRTSPMSISSRTAIRRSAAITASTTRLERKRAMQTA